MPQGSPQPTSRRLAWAVVTVLWFAGVAAGFVRLWSYEGAPGASAAAPRTWPEDTGLERESDGPTLLVFLHPRCPCSRTTLAELERLLVRVPRAPRPRLVFLADTAFGTQQTSSPLRARAANLPGSLVLDDPSGQRAAAFGARTSGDCLIYASDGTLRFHGGLTAARGHEGPNKAAEAAVRVLSGARIELQEFPAFGCALAGA